MLSDEQLEKLITVYGLHSPYVETSKVKNFDGAGVILPIRQREQLAKLK